uniref:CetG n=1 Tax=Actinomyces sp. Lu 9419 TaxID=416175 RepID=B5SP79_9ACTO|nr:CetG [Actinomyces sp. Lu 9419]
MVHHDWGLVATRDDGVDLPVPRGRVVGGCSAVNTCVALRPLPGDFDSWGPGWSWPEVLPHFRALESDTDVLDTTGVHGSTGPLPIRRCAPGTFTPLSAALVAAAKDTGFPHALDLNAPGATGTGALPLNLTADGLRISAASAYLDPVRDSGGLEVLAETAVDRVLFAGTRAVGVRVIADGRARDVRAERITVCAGTYATPAILHRSGVGPPELLRELGVEVISALPGVGADLSDHSQLAIGALPAPGVSDPDDPCAQVVLRYTAEGSSVPDDMQLYALNHVELDVYAPHLIDRAPEGRAVMVTSNLMAPVTRGRVTARSPDPAAPPRITFDHAREAEDLRRQRSGIRLCWEFLHHPAFAALIKETIDMDEPTVRSDSALSEHIRRSARTAHHPTGTARMGFPADPAAVVDHRCRVHGTEGLRVADASIVPGAIRANTNLLAMMIGERVAAWR